MEPHEEFNPALKPHFMELVDVCHELQASGMCVCFVDFAGHVNTAQVRVMERWADGEENIPLISETFRLINYCHVHEEYALKCRTLEESRLREFIQHLKTCLETRQLIEWRGA